MIVFEFKPEERPVGTLVTIRRSRVRLLKVADNLWHPLPVDIRGSHRTGLGYDDRYVRARWSSASSRPFGHLNDDVLADLAPYAAGRAREAGSRVDGDHWLAISRALHDEHDARRRG